MISNLEVKWHFAIPCGTHKDKNKTTDTEQEESPMNLSYKYAPPPPVQLNTYQVTDFRSSILHHSPDKRWSVA